jgi:hippurate hydrolase
MPDSLPTPGALRMPPTQDASELAFARRVRRAIHRRPELGHHERRTAAFLERLLRRLGLKPFRPAQTSVAVVIGPVTAPPAIGFRADIDALPICEQTGATYASRNSGVMHACGHDGHAAALLTFARRLTLEPARATSVLLVFQEAEEGYPSGAPAVLEGLPARLLPPEFFAFHLWPELPARVVGVRTGTMMASVAGLTIDVTGRPGRAHGTKADAGGADAVAAAASLYTRLAPDTGRVLDERSPTALSIGLIEGGEGPNRVAAHCRMEGTLRALSWAQQEKAVSAIRSAALTVEAETGAQIEVIVKSGIRPPVRNCADSVGRLQAACHRLAVDCRDYPDRPVGASEDFGWFLETTQGALFLLGCGRDEPHPDLHTARFDFDEEILLTSVDLFHALADHNW